MQRTRWSAPLVRELLALRNEENSNDSLYVQTSKISSNLYVDGVMFGAKSSNALESQIEALGLASGKNYSLADASGEGWTLVTEHMVVSPFAAKKRWTKREIILTFNTSENAQHSGTRYSDEFLSSKRLDRIVTEIVELISNANKRMQMADRRRHASCVDNLATRTPLARQVA